MQNFKIVDYDDPREHQEPVARWTYNIGARVLWVDAVDNIQQITVRFA